MTEEYNGWSNRETWAINLHLSNNESDYDEMKDRARDCVSEASYDEEQSKEDARREAIGSMAEYIKNWTEEVFEMVTNPEDPFDLMAAPEAARMFVSDVGSWWRADFYEIAEHWIDEAIESAVKS